MNTDWKADIAQWSKIDIEIYKLCFDQGQKRLNTLVEDGEKITNRSYALVGILVPLLGICMGTLINYIKNHEFGFGIVVSIAGTTSFTICLYYLSQLIRPRSEHHTYIEPKDIFVSEQLEFEFKSPDHNIKSLYFNELQHIQTKIDFNKNVNASRVQSFDFCLRAMIITAIILIIATLGFVIF